MPHLTDCRPELITPEALAHSNRAALSGCSVRLLVQVMAVVTGGGIISYALTFQSVHGQALVTTVALFPDCLSSNLYLIYKSGSKASSQEICLEDRGLHIAGLISLAVVPAVPGLQETKR